MYVCICNGLTETNVRKAAAGSGNNCPKKVYASLGCKPQCGLCIRHARDVVSDAIGSATGSLSPAVA